MIQRYRAFYEGKMYGVKAVIWTSRGLYVTLDKGNKAGRRVHGAVLMQSTGLFDVNGKEIFEGDVVKLRYFISSDYEFFKVTRFRGGSWRIDNRRGGTELWLRNEDCKVVGNVYQNPELLEEVE